MSVLHATPKEMHFQQYLWIVQSLSKVVLRRRNIKHFSWFRYESFAYEFVHRTLLPYIVFCKLLNGIFRNLNSSWTQIDNFNSFLVCNMFGRCCYHMCVVSTKYFYTGSSTNSTRGTCQKWKSWVNITYGTVQFWEKTVL